MRKQRAANCYKVMHYSLHKHGTYVRGVLGASWVPIAFESLLQLTHNLFMPIAKCACCNVAFVYWKEKIIFERSHAHTHTHALKRSSLEIFDLSAFREVYF